MSRTYESSMRTHEESAQRHEAAAALWDTRHEANRAEFERQCAQIERRAAQLDADRAELERLRVSGQARPDAAVRAEVDRLTGEIHSRGARLQADDAALEQQRGRLWPHHVRLELGGTVPAAKAASPPDAVTCETKRGESGAVDDGFGAARQATAQTYENATRLSLVLSHTADVLETSAVLAQANAERLERAGRAAAAAEERRAADQAHAAARRARLHERAWLEFARARRGGSATGVRFPEPGAVTPRRVSASSDDGHGWTRASELSRMKP